MMIALRGKLYTKKRDAPKKNKKRRIAATAATSKSGGGDQLNQEKVPPSEANTPPTTSSSKDPVPEEVPSAKVKEENVDDPVDWIWEGHWAFGDKIDPKNEVNKLPFYYTFHSKPNSRQHSTTTKNSATKLASSESTISDGVKNDTKSDSSNLVVSSAAVLIKQDVTATPSLRRSSSTVATTTTTYKNVRVPNSGRWKGSFETELVVAATSSSSSPHTNLQTQSMAETFDLVWDMNPSITTAITFHANTFTSAATTTATADVTKSSTTTEPSNSGAKVVDSYQLPSNHLPVTGKGSNKFGSFQVIGSLNIDTMELCCQKSYDSMVVGGSVVVTSTTGTTKKAGERSLRNKRSSSWKKRAADEEDGRKQEAASTNKRSRISRGRQAPTVLGDADGDIANASLSHANTAATLGGELFNSKPSPDLRVNIPNFRKRAPVAGVGCTLPKVGDQAKARWRAAHYLYYQREDDETSDPATPTSIIYRRQLSSPKYVVYEGEMLHGQRNGHGISLFSNDMIYEGSWKADKEHGVGTLYSADRKRLIYEGEWERGKMHGNGIFYYEIDRTKSRYEGEFRENLRHGDGIYVLPNGSVYDGHWKDGAMNGKGAFTWPDGSCYNGDWKDNKRQGHGKLKASDGFSYDGSWVNNTIDGRGSAIYPHGQQYNGMFSKGVREGRGSIIFTNGAVYEGRFRNDAIDGQGTMKMIHPITIPHTTTATTTVNSTAPAAKPDVITTVGPTTAAVQIPVTNLNIQKQELVAAVSSTSDEKNKTTTEALVTQVLPPESKGKEDFMMPLSFQSDMGHIHQKAGFTRSGQ